MSVESYLISIHDGDPSVNIHYFKIFNIIMFTEFYVSANIINVLKKKLYNICSKGEFCVPARKLYSFIGD